MPDEKGETRRQRNERVGEPSPELNIPLNGRYIWDLFTCLNNSISRIKDGVCYLIPPTEIKAWTELTGNLVTPAEYDILTSMDAFYCEETNKELQSMRSKQEEAQRRQIEEAKRKRGRR